MRLSDLQSKEIVNISNGRRIGVIVDVVVNTDGKITKLILEDRKLRRFKNDEFEVSWQQIVKVGDDIILIDTRNK